MKIYTGTSGYSYDEWKGNFYPDKIDSKDMLAFYAKKLPAVEINSTFYRMPTPNVVKSWVKQVPAGFVFAIKAPRMITHIKRLKNVKEETGYFLKNVSGLGKKLGCVLFQFPAGFHENNGLLEKFLGLIPPKTPCAFDFRSETWFNRETYALLKKNKACLCQEDTDENPAAELVSTAPWGYLRLRRKDYSQTELSAWSEKVSAQKWKKAFVFFKHEDDTASRGPELAFAFLEARIRS